MALSGGQKCVGPSCCCSRQEREFGEILSKCSGRANKDPRLPNKVEYAFRILSGGVTGKL